MDRVTSPFEMALEQVLENVRPKISDVGAAINGRTARVHAHPRGGGIARGKFLELARVGVKETQRHR
jgi:hypothetical protein